MLPLLFSMAVVAAPPPPDRARIQDMYDRSSAQALDPKALDTLAKSSAACKTYEEGETKNDFKTVARPVGSTVNANLSSPVADSNPVPPEERKPRYTVPEKRVPAAAFTYVDQQGVEKTVASSSGKTLIVFLFKPDCKFTADMMGEIIRLHSMQAGKAYEVVPVSIGREGWTNLNRWRQQNMNVIPKDFPIYYPAARAGSGTSVFGELYGTPTTLILDAHGRTAWQFNGTFQGALAVRLNQIMLEGLLETLPKPAPAAN